MSSEVKLEIMKNKSFKIILIFGIVSLLGDIVYEGIRSVAGPFLFTLGATSLLIGFFSGLGEFLTYGLRFLFGYFSDRKNLYWPFIITGYILIGCLPCLAFVTKWQVAVLLFLLERIGKAIRSPARDALISFAGKNIGYGKAFGIHEVLDQIGAVFGPLLLTFLLLKYKDYSKSFEFYWIPFFFLIIILLIAKKDYKGPIVLENKNEKKILSSVFSKDFIFYLLFLIFSLSGLINFPLISFYFVDKKIFSSFQVPVLYIIAMTVDGIFAMIAGSLYDKIKVKILFLIPFMSLILPFFYFSNKIFLILIGIIIYGAIIGCHETILKAFISDLIEEKKRGFAFGIFNSIYGFGLFISGWIMGFLFKKNIIFIYFFVSGVEILSIIILLSILSKNALEKSR